MANVNKSEPSEAFRNAVDTGYWLLTRLRSGGSFNVSTGPYLQDLSIQPAKSNASSSLLPWAIAGGLGLAVVLMLLGD